MSEYQRIILAEVSAKNVFAKNEFANQVILKLAYVADYNSSRTSGVIKGT